jgi:hypothetical protein
MLQLVVPINDHSPLGDALREHCPRQPGPEALDHAQGGVLILFQDATDRGVRKPSDKPMEWTQYTAPDGLGGG